MKLLGSIYITTDPHVVITNSITHNIICMSGDTEFINQYFSMIKYNNASILLPPYEALGAEVDGEMELFQQIYFDHLSKQLPNELITIILRALYNGKHILLFLTPSEYEMAYMKYFRIFMQMCYGLYIGDINTQFMFDENYTEPYITTLYMNNLMSYNEYLMMMPRLFTLEDNFPLIKLCNDLNPYNINDLQSAVDYFNQLKLESLKYNKELVIPVRGVDK